MLGGLNTLNDKYPLVNVPGGITGTNASFTSLLVNGNSVATIDQIPNNVDLSNYAQLSGATFSGPISGTTGSFTNLVTSNNANINGISIGLGSNNIQTNIAIGGGSLSLNSSGYNNTSIGNQSLQYSTSGNNNVAIGVSSLQYNTIGENNMGLGPFSLQRNKEGSNNIAIGINTLSTNTIGNNNMAIGLSSLNNSIGNNNVAIGHLSGTNNLTGNNNTFLGVNSDFDSNTSNYINSTAIGYNSKITNSDQIMLGGLNESNNKYPLINVPGGITGATGSFTSLLLNGKTVATTDLLPNLSGYAQLTGATFASLSATNQVNVSGGITGTTGSFTSLLSNGKTVATIDQLSNLSGYAQLSGATFTGSISGATGSFTSLLSNGKTVATTDLLPNLSGYAELTGATFTGPIYGTTGSFTSLTVSGQVTATSFNSTSDYRIKENIILLSTSNVVDNLNPVKYYNKISKKTDIGLIAHEVQNFYPELVSGEKDGEEIQTINYIGLIPILINEIKMLKKELKELKEKIE